MQLTDQIGNIISLDTPASRIVSLVPSQTELLYDLGLEEEVVGLTKFCIHPAHWRKEKTVVGGTKNHHLNKIRELKPDLIIANKEENTQAIIEKLYKICPVYVSDIVNLEDSYHMMQDIGLMTDKLTEAEKMVSEIQLSFQQLNKTNKQLKVAYCIWKKPWMWAGNDTFINHLLDRCGLMNVVDASRYPTIELGGIKELHPEVLLLSSEPYPFKEKHIDEIQKELPNTVITLVDGEMFSWYGSRLLKAAPYFESFLRQIHSYTL